jgi:hypothetical protein
LNEQKLALDDGCGTVCNLNFPGEYEQKLNVVDNIGVGFKTSQIMIDTSSNNMMRI